MAKKGVVKEEEPIPRKKRKNSKRGAQVAGLFQKWCFEMTIYFSGWKHILGFLVFPPKNRSADRDDRKGRKNPTICGGKKRCFSFLFFQHFFRLHHCSTSRTGGGKRKGKKWAVGRKKGTFKRNKEKRAKIGLVWETVVCANWPLLEFFFY